MFSFGSTFTHNTTQDIVTFEGFKQKQIFVLSDNEKNHFLINADDFKENYSATGEHNHTDYCCDEHNLHTQPHRGCLLR